MSKSTPISDLQNNNEQDTSPIVADILKEIENEPQEIPDVKFPEDLGNAKGNIIIKNINFSYEENKPIINDISLLIKAGQIIALVGPSGAGKSTLFSLLLRFNNLQSVNPNKYLRLTSGLVSTLLYSFNINS